jgi:hypothetical protein
LSLDIVYKMDFFKSLLGSPAKTEDVAMAAVAAAKTKKAAITEECAAKHAEVDKIISDAEAEIAKVKPVLPEFSLDTAAAAAAAGGKKKGGKSNKKRFSKGGKRTKSQKKRR